jgi:hypothetical protein
MKQLIGLALLLSGYAAQAQTAPPPVSPQSEPADGIDQGWAFEATPVPLQVDAVGGYLRFRLRISADGRITAAERVAGTMSAKQVKLCRQHILKRFTLRRTRPDAGAATGYFTFRYRVE